MRIGGTMWARKGQGGVLATSQANGGTREQQVVYTPFGTPGHRSLYTPSNVVVETLDGEVVEQREEPRAAFAGPTAESLWDELHAAYFSGYALWNYLNAPFVFQWPGVQSAELEPWIECSEHTGGAEETWHRLAVIFPSTIATLNTAPVFYNDDQRRQRRHDYDADVFGGTPTAHYSAGHRSFDGFVFPTVRRVVPRLADITTPPEPVLVSIDIDDITAR